MVRHASPDQELLGSVGVNKVLPDPAKDDGRLLGDRETILNVNQGQKPSVDIGVGVAAPRHDLKKRIHSRIHMNQGIYLLILVLTLNDLQNHFGPAFLTGIVVGMDPFQRTFRSTFGLLACFSVVMIIIERRSSPCNPSRRGC